MISHSQIYRARAALTTHYYADQADDYYSRDGDAATWQGDGARRLGAVGEIDPARFKAMLQGDFGRGIAADRSVARYYTAGDIVVPERDYQCRLKRGELYRVMGSTRHDRITVRPLKPSPSDTEPIEIIPKTMSKLS
jgi:hypothetical protein